MSNTDVSRELAKLWRDAPNDVRQMHIDEEFRLRQEYKVAMSKWREKAEQEKEREKEHRAEMDKESLEAVRAARQGSCDGGPPSAYDQ
eukprot:CAMPEP_0118721958 /NCGR_PEP_ID=MMETSP0800-20121206/31074_1 /TAXON_ID=210618 ORGANISM="Striatella unipunctata, Strain CCMP2910" /NCGR_SAMPLE_ID=MMETSP0800 /ASSEMBLY_ACC=CAM_ASM_000638 /LENGTH=87 /DNA_ID=CAMNT_0006630005 /DNA_START=42 /DNA_END=303 /DNA_ORIENTATION=+